MPPGQAPTIDPELLKEEADRASLTPEVATDLRLPEDDSVLGLDTFHGTSELVPLAQSGGDLNRNTAHNLIPGIINPASSSHPIVQLKGETAAVQMHVDSPVIYLRIGDTPAPPTGGAPLVVDTHGATGQATIRARRRLPRQPLRHRSRRRSHRRPLHNQLQNQRSRRPTSPRRRH